MPNEQLSNEQQWGLYYISQSPSTYIIGVDEVGTGAGAGPVLVCATVFKKTWVNPTVKDSKQYSGGGKVAHEKRLKVFKEVISVEADHYCVDLVSAKDIDLLGLENAVHDAMRRVALVCTHAYPWSMLVVDGNRRLDIKKVSMSIAIPKADALVPAVSAASVVAKTMRDAIMITSDDIHPGYGFSQNMGYLTPEHMEALNKLGPSPIHRRSYKPIQALPQK